MQIGRARFSKKILVSVAVMVVVILFITTLAVQRAGKVAVNIHSIPNDSSLFVDNKPTSKTTYLAPGSYTFSAKKEGWTEDQYKVTIGNGMGDIYLLPTPSSDEANKWLENNSGIQQQREAYGSLRANLIGVDFSNNNPIVKHLPYSDIRGPYKIDYGYNDNGGLYLVIDYSTPDSRKKALSWIKSKGLDPTDIVIEYADFLNPIESLEVDGGDH